MSNCYVLTGVFTIPDANDPPVTWMVQAEVDNVLDQWLKVPAGERGTAYTCFLPHFNHVYDGGTLPLRTLRLDSRGALLIGVDYNQPPPAT